MAVLSLAGLGQVLEFIYTAKLSLSSENVDDVLAVASFLQMQDIITACHALKSLAEPATSPAENAEALAVAGKIPGRRLSMGALGLFPPLAWPVLWGAAAGELQQSLKKASRRRLLPTTSPLSPFPCASPPRTGGGPGSRLRTWHSSCTLLSAPFLCPSLSQKSSRPWFGQVPGETLPENRSSPLSTDWQPGIVPASLCPAGLGPRSSGCGWYAQACRQPGAQQRPCARFAE